MNDTVEDLEFALCDQETAETLVSLFEAGCTLEETRAYFQVKNQRTS